ncbi:hypothetical protein ATJ93_4612 [Halopiger aswanensis]|uniref:Uncharacterized protein n=1 Tax=Halopiger aswanensis TaxID=148449 RepID=A0A419VVW4_9EURY|nr:hypothetical protein ATJ93_4612 [Halopiger aswanensis]
MDQPWQGSLSTAGAWLERKCTIVGEIGINRMNTIP